MVQYRSVAQLALNTEYTAPNRCNSSIRMAKCQELLPHCHLLRPCGSYWARRVLDLERDVLMQFPAILMYILKKPSWATRAPLRMINDTRVSRVREQVADRKQETREVLAGNHAALELEATLLFIIRFKFLCAGRQQTT